MKNFLLIVFLFGAFSSAKAYINKEGFVSIIAGKKYFDGDSSSLDFNANIFFSPVITIDEENIIYPIYRGYFSGVQDLKELPGGDILVRKRMGHNLSFKYVRSKDFNHIKPRFSYSLDFVNETKDEKWGEGLFDYKTISFGIEFEQERPDATYVESVDFYEVKYPNYSSLISNYSSVIDTMTYTELSKNAGKDVLNSRNIRVAFNYTIFPKNISVTYLLALTYRNFYDQSIVNKYGGFDSGKRNDMLSELGFSLFKADKKIEAGLRLNLSWLNSNQNSYDASRTKYIENYYSYLSGSITPHFKLNFKNGGSIGYSFSYERINYIDRLVQDVNGNYISSRIYQNFYFSNLYFNYPIIKGVMLRIDYSYQNVESNMKYKAGYRYDYSSAYLMSGVEWRF